MIARILDAAISAISPAWGVKRAAARVSLQQLSKYGGSSGGYAAGKVNRLNISNISTANENSVPRAQVSLLRQRSWDLYRNNPHCRKIVRSIRSKVIGRGMSPQSQAMNEQGQVDTAFRKRAKEVWERAIQSIDAKGLPGRGGQTLHEIARTALQSVVLSGEALVKYRTDGKYVPFSVQLVDAGRLDATKQSDRIYYGIELDAEDRRVKYHVLQTSLSTVTQTSLASVEVPAEQMLHIYLTDDIDQLRGTPWLAACIDKSRDIGDYEYNELKAAAMSACVVLGYRRSSGQNSFGLQADNWDLADSDGNKITNISPGMLMDLGNSGEIQGFNPQRPNANAAEFLNYQLRSVAAGMPGVKPSTVTGDYRNASFSSEKAADNDTWPEVEELQDWFAASFYQPIYEQIITAAVIAGKFDDVPGFALQDFTDRRANYLACAWRGPIQRSINPVDDVKAAMMRVHAGLSSPQREGAQIGANWQEVQQEMDEWLQSAAKNNLPTELIASVITPNPQLSLQVPTDATTGGGDNATISN